MADFDSSSTAKVALIAAAITAAPPLTAAVHGAFSSSRQAEAAKIDQDFKMRMAFLDRAIDPKSPPDDRHKVLRFLVAVATDKKMKSWAESELKSVTRDVALLRQAEEELRHANEQAAQANQAAQTAKTALEEEKKSRSAEKEQLEKAASDAAATMAAAVRAQRKAREAAIALGERRGSSEDVPTSTVPPYVINSCIAETVIAWTTFGPQHGPQALQFCLMNTPLAVRFGGPDSIVWYSGGFECRCKVASASDLKTRAEADRELDRLFEGESSADSKAP